jgi:hypothetical protein
MERVAIFNCVSTALGMLKFSSESLIQNAGTTEFDYYIVTWRPSDEVLQYTLFLIDKYPHIVRHVRHEEIPGIAYVPQLRAMMNTGFQACIDDGMTKHKWIGMVNTDMYFGKDWLINLTKHLKYGTNIIVNSLHMTRTPHPQHITVDLGVTEAGKFKHDEFNKLYDQHYKEDFVEAEKDGDWRAINTMPYLFHKKYWRVAGPWELNQGSPDTPDVRFFERCHAAGARFIKAHDSIVYHMEAAERTGQHAEKTQPGLEASTMYAE